MSDETGESEIYVQSFPEPGRKVRVSLDGGSYPTWLAGGSQLSYLNLPRRERILVPVNATAEFLPGSPHKIADLRDDETGGGFVGDGARRLVSVAEHQRPRAIRLILDWTALLTR